MKYEISGKTKIVGILGYPIEHTFSPGMQNAAFSTLGLDWIYVPFQVLPEALGEAVAGLRAMGLRGVNVTIPHKQEVMQYLDTLSPEAQMIGAVNTIVNQEGCLKGYNTDAPGFVRSLKEDAGVTPQGKKIMVMGAGGAARAVAFQLALEGADELDFVVRDEVKGRLLADEVQQKTGAQTKVIPWLQGDISKNLGDTHIIINSTPIGMGQKRLDILPLDIEAISDSTLVCDLIYNPRETVLLEQARKRGLKTLNGMGMLLYQGAIAFELWTGEKAPIDVMKSALEGIICVK